MDKATLLKIAFDHVKEDKHDMANPQFDIDKEFGPDAYGGDKEALMVIKAFENFQTAGHDLLQAMAVLGRKYGLHLNPR